MARAAAVIVGLGLDVVATERIARLLESEGDRFADRVVTASEPRECHGRADQTSALAARFAANGACLTALGTGWQDSTDVHHIDVSRSGDTGPPTITVSGRAAEPAQARPVRTIHVTRTHDVGVAAAAVILEG